MKTKRKLYICDDCGREDEFESYIKARNAGWAVAKDYTKCYCPSCAPEHRRGAANIRKRSAKLAQGWEQLRIDTN